MQQDGRLANGLADSDKTEKHDTSAPNYTVRPFTLASLFLKCRSKDNGLKD